MRLPIRYKLLIGFAFLVLLSSLVQAFTFSITRDYLTSQIGLQLSEKAQTAANAIDDFFTTIYGDLGGIDRSYKKNPVPSNQATSIIIQNTLETDPYIKNVTILSETGRELLKITKNGQVPDDKLSFEILTDAFKSAKAGITAISKVYYLPNDPKPHVDIFAPIFADKDTIIAIDKMEIDISQLWGVISKIKIGNNGFAYLVDNEGRLLAHPDQNFVDKRPILTQRKIIASMLHNDAGSLKQDDFFYDNEKNIHVIARAVNVQGVDWLIVFEQPESEAFAFLLFIRNVYLFTLIGSVSLLLLISFFLSENLTRSIRALQVGIEQLKKGRETDIVIQSGDEIELLAGSFHTMANQLLQREQLLRKEKQEIETIVQSLTDGVIAIDQNDMIFLFNKAAEKILATPYDQTIGKPIDTILQWFDDEERLPFVKASDQSDTMINKLRDSGISTRIRSGKTIFLSVIISPVIFELGENSGWIIAFHDITAQRELEEMKLDFVSMAAHELRTPLTSIRGYAALLKDTESTIPSPEVKEYIKRLTINSDNLSGLIENLLNVSRIERNTFKIDTYPVNLVQVITEAIANMNEQAKTKNQTMTFHLPHEQLPPVMADEFRMTQVINNLLANAISYTQPGGAITIMLVKKNDVLEVSVADNGPGIPPDALPKLFTKFFRVSGALEQGSKGTGLGLFIAKSIITMHRGTIWVESTQGKGTTLFFTVPIATENDIAKYQQAKLTSSLTGSKQQGIIFNKEMFQKRFGKNYS